MTKDRRKQTADESYCNASVAQRPEQVAFNHEVESSNLSGGTDDLVVVPLKISEEQKMFTQWFNRFYEESRRRLYEACGVPKRYFDAARAKEHRSASGV